MISILLFFCLLANRDYLQFHFCSHAYDKIRNIKNKQKTRQKSYHGKDICQKKKPLFSSEKYVDIYTHLISVGIGIQTAEDLRNNNLSPSRRYYRNNTAYSGLAPERVL